MEGQEDQVQLEEDNYEQDDQDDISQPIPPEQLIQMQNVGARPQAVEVNPGSFQENFSYKTRKNDENLSLLPCESDYLIFQILFDLFDRQGQDCIDLNDFQTVVNKLDYKVEDVFAQLRGFDETNDLINFQQFFEALWTQNQKAEHKSFYQSQLPNGIRDSFQTPESQHFEKRTELIKEYGAMIPSKDVQYTPNQLTLKILKLFRDYLNQCHRESNYVEAKRVKERFNQVSAVEFNRQIKAMEHNQEQELNHVEQMQRQQFQEFTDAWDSYMGEYEQNAFQSVEKLKQDQAQELEQFKQTFLSRVQNRYQQSKKIMDVKVAEKKAFVSQQYDEAQRQQRLAEQMEIEERHQHLQKLLVVMEKEEQKLRQKMAGFMNTLLKRIQRDRDEQLAHRKADSQTIIQKNKNVLQDIISRHNLERKRTSEFLRYALSNRSKQPGQLLAVQKIGLDLPKIEPRASTNFNKAVLTEKISRKREDSKSDEQLTITFKKQTGNLPHLMNSKDSKNQSWNSNYQKEVMSVTKTKRRNDQ